MKEDRPSCSTSEPAQLEGRLLHLVLRRPFALAAREQGKLVCDQTGQPIVLDRL